MVQTNDPSAVRAATTASPVPFARSSQRSSPVSSRESTGMSSIGPDTVGAADPLGRISVMDELAAML